MQFRWIGWNIEHIAEHGVAPEQAESVVKEATEPYPLAQADEKFLVRGQDPGGRYLQVVYVVDPDATVFVIHARPLTSQEKKRFEKRRRR